jgi:phosphatidylinositol alpha-1,6-mannosyltransferase
MNKIAFLSYTFYPVEGGIQTYMKQVALHQKKSDVRVYCKTEKDVPATMNDHLNIERFSFGSNSYIFAAIKILKILFSDFKNPFAKLKLYFLLLINRCNLKDICNFTDNMLKSQKSKNFIPDIVHCSVPLNMGLIGLILKLKYATKLVTYIHGSELLMVKSSKNKCLLLSYLFSKSDVVIANSNYTMNQAVEVGCKPSIIEVVNLGADTTIFYPKSTKAEMYSKYNIPSDNILIYTISHLVPRKGNDMMIRALAKIIATNPKITYLIGGRGKYKETLEQLIAKNGLENNVKFTGFIDDDDLNKLMNACDIFAMPNRQEGDDVEGYGIVFMEANACKKPVIVGNSGGAVDAVIDGKTGFLVDPCSVDDIAEKLLHLLGNDQLRKDFGENGYNLVVRERNWESISNKINKITNNL